MCRVGVAVHAELERHAGRRRGDQHEAPVGVGERARAVVDRFPAHAVDHVAVVVCAAAAASVGRLSLAVAVGGMLLAAAYSLPPFSLSGRGVVAPLVLPLGLLAVPFVVGVEAAGSAVGKLVLDVGAGSPG